MSASRLDHTLLWNRSAGDPVTLRQGLGRLVASADVSDEPVRSQPIVAQLYGQISGVLEHIWGQSFHFAARFADETHGESLRRDEHNLALRMELRPGMHVLDVGCGIGGPMRNISRFADVSVTGITISEPQVKRGEALIAEAGLSDRCRFICGDYLDIPCADASFDAAYAFESTCHVPDRRLVFEQVWRVLRPGAVFAGYDWCLTDRFQPGHPEHERIRRVIDEAWGVRLLSFAAFDEALRTAGFELLDTRDACEEGSPETPWFRPFTRHEGGLRGLGTSPTGGRVIRAAVSVLEALRIAPSGSRGLYALLSDGVDVLVRGGELGIMTPHYYCLARKPDGT